MFVSVTRLHVRGWLFLPLFGFHTLRSLRQVRKSAGLVGGRLAAEAPFAFWTITVWTDDQAMRAFRNTSYHLKAMPKLMDWCDEASYVHWRQDGSGIPPVAEVFTRLRDSGKISKVRHPSATHASGKTVGASKPKAAGEIRPS